MWRDRETVRKQGQEKAKNMGDRVHGGEMA